MGSSVDWMSNLFILCFTLLYFPTPTLSTVTLLIVGWYFCVMIWFLFVMRVFDLWRFFFYVWNLRGLLFFRIWLIVFAYFHPIFFPSFDVLINLLLNQYFLLIYDFLWCSSPVLTEYSLLSCFLSWIMFLISYFNCCIVHFWL